MTDTNGSDLVCKAHNASLSNQEQRQLDRLLQSSPEVRLMNLIVGQLDRDSVAQPGDDAVVRAIAARVVHRRRWSEAWIPRRQSRRLRPLLAAAVVLGLTGLVAAAWWGTLDYAHAPDAPASNATVLKDSRVTSSDARVTLADERSTEALPDAPGLATQVPRVATPDAPGPAMQVSRVATPDASRSAIGDAPPSVDELFAEANRCRRQGEPGRASALYRRVIDTSSKSREAMLSRLALAKMEEVSHPKLALQLYQALTKEVSEVRPEALWGTAEVARRLGQSGTERAALETLLHEFPKTSYATAAQQRLQDVER